MNGDSDRERQKRGVTSRVPLAFGVALVSLLAVASIAYRAITLSSDSDRWVNHTHQVLEKLQDLRLAIDSVDADSVKFVITGNESILKSHQSNISRQDADLSAMDGLTRDNPAQQRMLSSLKKLATQKSQFAELIIRLRRAQGPESATETMEAATGQPMIEQFDGAFRDLRNEELRLLVLRNADANRHSAEAKVALILTTLLGMLVVAGAGWNVWRGNFARAAAEEGLRESEDRFRTLANNISQFSWMADKHGQIFWYSDQWFDYMGVTLEEIAGSGWQKAHHPEHVARVVARLSHCFATGEVWNDTFPVRGGDGRYRWFDGRAIPIRDQEGNVSRWLGTNTDITEARAAAIHLTQMESRYRGLLEAAPDAMVVVDQSGGIVLLNAQSEKQFGYSRDELIGQQVKNIIPEGFAERLIADGTRTAAEALAQHIGTGIELSGRRKDGSEFPIEIMLSPLQSAEGILVTAAIRDIATRKEAESQLLHKVEELKVAKEFAEGAESRYRGLLEAAPDAMVVVDQSGEIVLLNAQSEKQFGYSRDELIGQQVKNIIPEGFAERLIADGTRTAAEALAQHIGTGIELSGRRKDGSEFPIEIMLSPLESAEGILVTAAIRDIATRKEAETQLLHKVEELKVAKEFAEGAESRYRGLLEAAPDAMVVVDQSGGIVLLNAQSEKQFGYSRDELIGQRVKNIIPEGFAERLIADGTRTAAEALAQQIGTGIELSGRRKDGSKFPIEIMLSPLQSAEGILVTAAIRDIATRKEAETQLLYKVAELKVAKEFAEEASRLKSEFLANMSHEIRTPMNGIIGMTELTLDTQLSDEQRDYIDTVRSSGESLLSIINDVLDFSKSEAGQFCLEAADFNPDDLLQDVVHTMAVGAHQKGLELLYDARVDLPELVVGDGGRLRQIVVNLLANAIKFTESGEVTVTIVDVVRHHDRITLHVSVSDTGLGISPEWRTRIFDAFVQVDGSNTRRYGGTGLGLAISTRLVNLMGGRLWVESELGRGSTFHFDVNVGISTDRRERVQPPPLEALQGLPVLVVDDNATNRRILNEMLMRQRMKPVLAACGRQALEILREHAERGEHFSLILVDAQMPEMDGFMLSRQIQETSLLGGPRIMMLSSVEVRGERPELRATGPVHYLVKPVTRASLSTAMLQVLGDRQPKAVPATPQNVASVAEQPLHILLAEDNLVNQRVVSRLLEKAGHATVIVSSGSEAVERFTRESFDLILMDIQMPGMNGYEATRSIRAYEQRTGGHIPIVAVTAHALKGDREICLEAGMDDYLTKPVRSEALKAVLERWVMVR